MEILVSRKDISQTRARPQPPLSVADGQVLVRIVKFAFTANNVSYATAGETLKYFDFFPAVGAEQELGAIPTWGIGVVTVSRHPGVEEGARLYGFFPMSTFIVLTPGSVGRTEVVDSSAHRTGLPHVYNVYQKCDSDPLYAAEIEDVMCLIRPLYLTSWIIDDFLESKDFFGARTLVLTSASSKTSYGLAYEAKARRRAVRVVGLTSSKSIPFVRSLDLYDDVVSYDAIGSLARDPAVVVDMAGNTEVLVALYAHFAEHIKYACLVGQTHWQAKPAGRAPRLTPKPEFFFAPAHFARRIGDWGNAGLSQRLAASWLPFARDAHARGWCAVVRAEGCEAVTRMYADFVANRVAAADGYMCSLPSCEKPVARL